MSTIKPEKNLTHHLFMNFRNNLTSLYSGNKLRFLYKRNHQPILGPGNGHINKPDQPFTGFIGGNDPVHAHQVHQVKVQPLGAMDADQGYLVDGDIKKLLGAF